MKNFEYERRVTSINNKNIFEDGDILKCEIKNGDRNVEFNFYYWSKETYNELLQKSGFKNIQWVEPIVSEAGINKFGKEYWNNFLKNPSSTGFVCTK